MQARKKHNHYARPLIAASLIGCTLSLLSSTALAQVSADVQRDAAEQRRAQERESLLREQQERTPDIRLPTGPAKAGARLPSGETPCFVISHIVLNGDTSGTFQWLLPALAGPQGDDSPIDRCLGAQGVAQLLQRGQDALVARGFVTSRVLATPQDMSKGTLTLTVLPGKVRAIRFKPVQDPSVGEPRVHIGPAVPIQSGDILNLRDIEQALENFKRVPTAEVDIQIVPADQPDHSDLVIAYESRLPLRMTLAADDSGSRTTGKYQGSATLSWDNPLGLSDLFYLTLSHDLGGGDEGPRGTQGYTTHYSLPVGYWTLSGTASSSRYHQKVVGLTQDYVYSGTSENTELKVSRMVYRDAVRKTSTSLKAWQRKSNNFIDDTEVMVQRRVVGGWELGVNHKDAIGTATVEGSLSHKRGTGDFDSLEAPEEALGNGTSRFGLWILDANVGVPFKALGQSFQYSGSIRVQDNTTPLTPQDRFAIGGRYTVRGFDGESSLSGERGWTLRNEVSFALGESGQQAYLGVDAGEVSGPGTEYLLGKSLSGAVIGLRGNLKKLQYDLFVGTALYTPDGFKTADTTAGFSLNLSF